MHCIVVRLIENKEVYRVKFEDMYSNDEIRLLAKVSGLTLEEVEERSESCDLPDNITVEEYGQKLKLCPRNILYVWTAY